MRLQLMSALAALLYVSACFASVFAQEPLAVHSVDRSSLTPGETTRLQIHGKGFTDQLRVLCSEPIELSLVKVEATQASIDLKLPPTGNPPYLGIWFTDGNLISSPFEFVVDSLVSTIDNGTNHSLETAQVLALPTAVEGNAEAKMSDFYRFPAKAQETYSFDLIAHRIGSPLDGVLKIKSVDGKVLATVDDTDLGPDSRLSWTAPADGDYTVEIHDNRYTAGGRYRLRVGAFPLVHAPFPPIATAIQSSDALLLTAQGPVATSPTPATENTPPIAADANPHQVARTVQNNSLHSLIYQTPVCNHPIFVESSPKGQEGPLALPIGIAGILSHPKEVDSFQAHVDANQSITIRTLTKRIDSPAVLRLEIFHPNGTKMNETALLGLQQETLPMSFTEAGDYKLQVRDMLGRGGDAFAYYLELLPKESFSIAMKPDPASTMERIVETGTGAMALDLDIARTGYAGAIDLKLLTPTNSWRILNPTIPENQNAHRVYLVPTETWKESDSNLLSFGASPRLPEAAAAGSYPIIVKTEGWFKAKYPGQSPFDAWRANRFVAVGSKAKEPVDVLLSKRTFEFATTVPKQDIVLPLGDIAGNWLKPNVLLPFATLPGLTITGNSDDKNVSIQASFDPEFAKTKPSEIALSFYSEISGRGRIQTLKIPLVWYDPPERIESFPQQVDLKRRRDQQKLIVSGWDKAGIPKDWSSKVHWTLSDPTIAEFVAGAIVPKKSGNCELKGTLGHHQWTIPVQVQLPEAEPTVEFENEVLVALSKQGCNSGACHGSPSGKGGFRLSLRAFDRVLDEYTLTREFMGRRINSMEPEESLLLKKALMKVPHGGGMQIHKTDPAYAVLRDWIAAGAKLDGPEITRCVRLEVYPNDKRLLHVRDGKQQLAVRAHFANGSTRDVTSYVSYESSNTTVATVSKSGWVEPLQQGETVVLVRFLEHIESVPFLFVEPNPAFEWKQQPTLNPIDEFVDTKLQLMQINASPICSDEVFLRRVHLDLIGLLPTSEETKRFVEDPAPDKRTKLVDTLLDRPEYAKFWALKWSDLLRVTSKGLTEDGVYKYHRWIEDSIRENLPYDQFAKQLLASTGSTFVTPAANFYRSAKDTNDSVETVSQIFLGARLQCAKCHNHPFERWTQDNYYGLGAYFHRVQRTPATRPNEILVWAADSGEVTQPRTGQVMKPWAPGADTNAADDGDRRERFVHWLVQPDNPYFARVEANRIWSHLFARGIVDPIDDFRDSNPPTNRPLLDALSDAFVKNGYDRKQLIRFIVQSRTYQSAFEPLPTNEKDTLYFSHQEPRLLTAEQLLDAINQLTGTDTNFGNLPVGTKATQLPAPDVAKLDFLRVFGQPERSTVCACERSDDSNLGMAIELFNGSLIYEKLRDPNNRFRKALAAGTDLENVVRSLYQSGLARNPTDVELQQAIAHCQSKPDVASGVEDLCWVLLNTDEFLFQH